MDIRTVLRSDARAIAEIHLLAWRSAYRGLVPQAHLDGLSVAGRETYWAAAIEEGHPHILVAQVEAGVVGWVAFDRCRDIDKPNHTGEVWAIYILPGHIGQGVGRDLWSRACAMLRETGYREVTVWVLARNHRACHFYATAGFTPEVESAKMVQIGGVQLQEVRYVHRIAA